MRGVTFNAQTGKWRASLGGYGRNDYIGEFAEKSVAEDARRKAEISMHGSPHQDVAIQIDGQTARVPIFGRRGIVKCWIAIDVRDVPLVEGRRLSITRSGYAVFRAGEKIIYLHRLIEPRNETTDHRDGDRRNNQRSNLRPCSQAENTRNRQSLSRNNSSGAKGVSKTASGSWRARIWLNWKEIYLGAFPTIEDATRAYDEAARKLHGEFASPNRQANDGALFAAPAGTA